MKIQTATAQDIESPYAWTRLFVSLVLMTIGGSGMYTVSVVLPRIQAEFAVARGDASLPYTLAMIGFGLGGVLMGKLSDRFGVLVPVSIGAVFLGVGFIVAGSATSLWQFSLAQGVLMGRKPKLTDHQRREALRMVRDEGRSLRDVAKHFNVSHMAIARLT